MMWGESQLKSSTLTVPYQDEPGYHHHGNRDQLGQHRETDLSMSQFDTHTNAVRYAYVSMHIWPHMYRHTHTHTHIYIKPCLSIHSHAHKRPHTQYISQYLNYIQWFFFSFVQAGNSIQIIKCFNHLDIEIYIISQSESEYLIHSHCNIQAWKSLTSRRNSPFWNQIRWPTWMCRSDEKIFLRGGGGSGRDMEVYQRMNCEHVRAWGELYNSFSITRKMFRKISKHIGFSDEDSQRDWGDASISWISAAVQLLILMSAGEVMDWLLWSAVSWF